MRNTLYSGLMTALLAASLLLPAGCTKEPPAKRHVIGIVNLTPRLDPVIEGLRTGMSGYGYVEGNTIQYVYNGAAASKQEARRQIETLLAQDVDLLFTLTGPATLMAKELTRQTHTPVVFAPLFDPVKAGVVNDLGVHECNVTGVQVSGHSAKALEWLLKADPSIKRILVPIDKDSQAAAFSLSDLQQGAEILGVHLDVVMVNSVADLEQTLSNIDRNIDALWLLNSYFLATHVDLFVKASTAARIPIGSGTSQYQSGIVVTYGQELQRTGEIAARIVHRILTGAHPAEIPIESTEFFLGINLKQARAIGLEVPPSVLQQADHVLR